MDKIQIKIEDRIRSINYKLPSVFLRGVSDTNQLKSEIKNYRNKNLQNRFRNLLLALLALAIIALMVDNDNYQYYILGGIAFLATLVLLSPSAKYARTLTLARQKLFLMELLMDMHVPVPDHQTDDVYFEGGEK